MGRLAGFVEERDFSRVQPARAARRGDWFFGDVEHFAAGQHFAILEHERIRLRGWEQVSIRLADEVVPRHTQKLLAGAVEPLEAELRGLLHEDHGRNGLENRVYEAVGCASLGLRALLLREIF